MNPYEQDLHDRIGLLEAGLRQKTDEIARLVRDCDQLTRENVLLVAALREKISAVQALDATVKDLQAVIRESAHQEQKV